MDNIKGIVQSITEQRDINQGKQGKRPFIVQMVTVQSTRSTASGTFSNTLPIQATGEKLPMLNGIQPGMQVDVDFFVNGREYNKKDGSGVGVFVSLSLAKIIVVSQPQYSQQGQPINQVQQPQYQQPVQGGVIQGAAQVGQQEDDDLPF